MGTLGHVPHRLSLRCLSGTFRMPYLLFCGLSAFDQENSSGRQVCKMYALFIRHMIHPNQSSAPLILDYNRLTPGEAK